MNVTAEFHGAPALHQNETEEFSNLVGSIYDAALDADRWPEVLGKILAYVGGQSAAMFHRDMVKRKGEVYYDFNVPPEFKSSYFEKYIKFDPTLIGYNLAPVGQPISTADVMPYDEFTQSRFYKEWAVPQGLVDSVGVVLERTATTAAIIGIMRSEMADEASIRRMKLVSPHARRAVQIGTLLDWQTTKAEGLADSLDGIQTAFFMVDAHARVLHTNDSGTVLLEKGNVFRLTAGRLAIQDSICESRFASAISAGRGADAFAIRALDDSRYVAHILRLSRVSSRKVGTGNASAAIFVTNASADAPFFPNVVASAFALTPSEVRMLLAIVEIGNVSKAAEALGIAETTAKFHLSNVFAKTGTSKQVELVKLVAAYASPLAQQ
jgi:DNA-binding CsgD family transcriptional regulator